MKSSNKPALGRRFTLAASLAAIAFLAQAPTARAQATTPSSTTTTTADTLQPQTTSPQADVTQTSSSQTVPYASAQSQPAPYAPPPSYRRTRSRFNRLNGATFSVSATNLWTTPVTNNAGPVNTIVGTPPNALQQTVSGQEQGATSKPGVLAQLGLHPLAWAGVEINYQFAQFDEQYSFNYSSQPGVRQYARVPVAFHEFTAAYQFHPPHIKFQPYVNIGGGAVDFLPYLATNQWRAAGLVETGFDIPTKSPHVAIRIQGRALIYRAPNFTNRALSTRSWVVTEEPSAGLVYRF